MIAKLSERHPDKTIREILDSTIEDMDNPKGGWPAPYLVDVSKDGDD